MTIETNTYYTVKFVADEPSGGFQLNTWLVLSSRFAWVSALEVRELQSNNLKFPPAGRFHVPIGIPSWAVLACSKIPRKVEPETDTIKISVSKSTG